MKFIDFLDTLIHNDLIDGHLYVSITDWEKEESFYYEGTIENAQTKIEQICKINIKTKWLGICDFYLKLKYNVYPQRNEKYHTDRTMMVIPRTLIFTGYIRNDEIDNLKIEEEYGNPYMIDKKENIRKIEQFWLGNNEDENQRKNIKHIFSHRSIAWLSILIYICKEKLK